MIGTLRSVLDVPASMAGNRDAYFNRRSRLIVLELEGRGPILAHYVAANTLPDAVQNSFYAIYDENAPIFRGIRAPEIAPVNVRAFAFPVARGAEDEAYVYSGAASDLGSSGPQTSASITLIPPGQQGSAMARSGLRMDTEAFEVFAGGGGLAVDGSGVRTNGVTKMNSVVDRGMMIEPPIYSVIPKTAVTMPADYQPSINKINEILGLIAKIIRVTVAVHRIALIILTKVGASEQVEALREAERRVDQATR